MREYWEALEALTCRHKRDWEQQQQVIHVAVNASPSSSLRDESGGAQHSNKGAITRAACDVLARPGTIGGDALAMRVVCSPAVRMPHLPGASL